MLFHDELTPIYLDMFMSQMLTAMYCSWCLLLWHTMHVVFQSNASSRHSACADVLCTQTGD